MDALDALTLAKPVSSQDLLASAIGFCLLVALDLVSMVRLRGSAH
jgi:hypothetical protein